MIFLLNRNKKSDDTSPERIPRLRITSILSVSPKPKIFISMRMYDSRVSSSTEVNTRMIRFYDILVPSLFKHLGVGSVCVTSISAEAAYCFHYDAIKDFFHLLF